MMDGSLPQRLMRRNGFLTWRTFNHWSTICPVKIILSLLNPFLKGTLIKFATVFRTPYWTHF